MSDEILTQGRARAEGAGPGFTGKKNAYECDGLSNGPTGCGAYIVTVDADNGVTPFMLKCGRCGGYAHSKMYRVADHLVPTHEWYRPDTLDGIERAYFDHLSWGGLILRPVSGGADEWLLPMGSDPLAKAKEEALLSVLMAAKMRAARAEADRDFAVKELRKEPMSRQQRRHRARKGLSK